MTEDEAQELCDKLAEQSKEVQDKMDNSKAFLIARQKDTKMGVGGAAHTETLQKLQERLTEAIADFAKAKKVITDNEQKFVSKKLLAEATALVEASEAEVSKATSSCAPLVENGGMDFLVATSVQRLAGVLREYMAEKDLTEDSLFNQVSDSNGEGKVQQDAFVTYLETLPAVTKQEEITFTQERQVSIFQHMDADKDGAINLSDFKQMFKRQFQCKQQITLTDVFEIAKSKTKGKVDMNVVVEALGNAKKDESTGMTRMECKLVSSGKTGFVTMLGNGGTVYLEEITPFMTFATDMDKALDKALKVVTDASNFLKLKAADLTKAGTKGPLAEARNELAKLRLKITVASANLDQLKKKVMLSKREYAKKEEAEKNAHIEIRERKEADAILSEAAAKVEETEAAGKELETVALPLTSLQGAELDVFATPLSVLEAAERLQASMTESVTQTRAALKDQRAKIGKVVKGPMFEAKLELAKLESRLGALEKKVSASMEAACNACQSIVDARFSTASACLREEVARRVITPEDLFAELAQGEDRITHEALCKYMDTLDGLNMQPEQAQLLCRHIEVGGIGKRKFLSLLQRYFVVVRSIAITNAPEISEAKTIRKAEADEVLEVVEGPRTDSKVGLTRVKGKSLIDGQVGWITVCGNQGTPFLH